MALIELRNGFSKFSCLGQQAVKALCFPVVCLSVNKICQIWYLFI